MPIVQNCRQLIALLLGVVALTAQGASAPYGAAFVRVGAQWPESAPRGKLEEAVPPDASSEPRYREQLQQLELEQGPYAARLSEPLMSLGRAYLQQGAYQQAVAMYSRAIHVARVNDGLYSEQQVPFVRGLLAAYRASADWQALDERYAYYFRLFGAGQPPFTNLRVAAALEFLRWQREALRLDLPGEKRRLLATLDLNESLLQSLSTERNASYDWRKDLAFSQLLNLYQLQQRVEPRKAQMMPPPRSDYFGAKPLVADLETQQLDSLLRGAPSRGASLMAQLLPEARLKGPREEAQVQLALADWHFWNRDRRRAAAGYAAAYELLIAAQATDLLQQWFGQPVELPDNGVFWQPLAGGVETAVVHARYDVSADGRLENLEVEQVSGGEAVAISSFRRKLTATLFRPRWSAAGPQAATGVSRNYLLPD